MKHIEIERKYLIHKHIWDRYEKPHGNSMEQGYLCTDNTKVIRIRVTANKGFLTIKGKMENLGRPEFEYAIPEEEAQELLSLSAGYAIEKTRYKVPFHGKIWDVDIFHGENEGLCIAEIELDSPDEVVDLPDWVGTEVTHDPRYFNAYLSSHPFLTWKQPADNGFRGA